MDWVYSKMNSETGIVVIKLTLLRGSSSIGLVGGNRCVYLPVRWTSGGLLVLFENKGQGGH